MTDAIIVTIASGLPEDREALQGVLRRVFPNALTAWVSGSPQIAIPLADIREEAPDKPVVRLERKDEDHDQLVLSYLLYTGVANCAQEQYADILWRVHRGEGREGDARVLETAGLRYLPASGDDKPASLAVIEGHPAIRTVFKKTRWNGIAFRRIRQIEGTTPKVRAASSGATEKLIVIPMSIVTALIPEVPY